MAKFYFTYGIDGHPFVGGWTEVEAPDMPDAIRAFNTYHPPKIASLVNCCGIYTEEGFRKTTMYLNGNIGHRCHETISVNRTLTKGEINKLQQKQTASL